MIMDEVTANLDPIMEKQVEEAIWSLYDPGILYITHHWEESFLCRADHVLNRRAWHEERGLAACRQSDY